MWKGLVHIRDREVHLRGFVKLKKMQKFEKNSEVGGGLCCFHVSKCFQKKMHRGVNGWGLTNPSFSRIFGFFSTWQDPQARENDYRMCLQYILLPC